MQHHTRRSCTFSTAKSLFENGTERMTQSLGALLAIDVAVMLRHRGRVMLIVLWMKPSGVATVPLRDAA